MNESRFSLSKGSTKRLILWLSSCLLVVGLVGGGFWWLLARPASLLPEQIARQVTRFTPYFFEGAVPAGYSFDSQSVVSEAQMLTVPFKKQGAADIVLVEQELPTALTAKELLGEGEKIKVTQGEAFVSEVEGRMVGAFIDPSHNTLVLLNATGAEKNDIVLFLQNLRPY